MVDPPPSDATPPAVNLALPFPGETGWFTAAPVTGSVSANDSSNVADITCTGATVSNKVGLGTASASATLTFSAEGVSNVTCTAKDGANNTGAATGSVNTGTVKIDTVAPTVTPADVANTTWRNSSLAQAFTASDAGSGLAVAEDASFTLTASAESANASTPTSESKTVADVAGNTTTRSVSALIDKTAPVVTVAGVADGDSYAYGSVPAVTCSTTDALSGVDKEATLGSSGGPTGSVTYTCNAATDKAGNSGSASATITVTKLEQVINFGTLANKTYGDASFDVSATGGASGNAVTFTASGKCSVSGDTVSLSGAGDCTVTVSQKGNDTYNAAQSVAQSFNIAKATATVTVTDYSGVYDGKAHGVSGSAQGVNNEDLISLLNLGDKHTNAGSYSVAWTFAGNENYKDAGANANITIAKAAAIVSLSNLSYVYDGTTKAATASTTPEGLTVTLSYSATPTNAGSYSVTATVDDANYEGSATGSLSIAKADQTISWSNPADTTYGAVLGNAQLNASLTTGNGALSYTPAAGTKLGAGTHTLSVNAAATDNYNAASTTVQLVVNKANATLEVFGFSGLYDGQAHGASGTATGVDNEDLGNLLSLGNTFTDAPGGKADWSFTGDANYNPVSGSADIVISKIDATINVTGFTGIYDGQEHGASGAATGVKGETLGGLDLGGKFTNVPGGTANWTFTDTTGNYNSGSGTAQITINKADQTISFNAPASAVYNSSFDVSASASSGLPVSFAVSGVCSLSGASVTTTSGTGSCTVTASQAGDGNYNAAPSVTPEVAAVKADATVSVNGYSGVYDGNAHGASGAATGVNNGENLGSLLNLGDSFTNVPGGTANWSFVGNDNYKATSGSASITITKATATVSLSNLNYIFDGTAKAATATTTPAGLSVILSYSPGTPVAVGSYSVSATVKDTNYQGNASGTLTIAAWTLQGFYQPVAMGTDVYNTVKGGSTVPMKFNIYAGSAERTSTGDVKSFQQSKVACASGMVEDTVDVVTTGGTSLRYGDGQFIQNWQTPKAAGSCYKVTLTTSDNSTIIAYFKLK